MWAVWVLLLWRADYRGWSGKHGGPPVQLVSRACLMQRLPVAGWWGWMMRQLAVELCGVPGLVLVH